MSKEFNSNKPLIIGSVSQEGDRFVATVSINGRSTVFDGHFPDLPILPGVVMIDLIHELTAQSLKQPVRMTEASNIKFLQVILPEKETELLAVLTLSESPDLIRMNALVTDPLQNEVFKGQFVYVRN